jgi:glycyl-tRNA synthetase beta chain
MPELLLELLSEEIPARMQAGAESTLRQSLLDALAPLSPRNLHTYSTPRRIAAVLDVDSEVPAATRTERGPRTTAPEAALSGFLRKHNAPRDQLVAEAEYWVLHIATLARPAASLIAEALPPLLRRFPWPKSMRWGGTSAFTWVRPLRRILCLLGGTVVPFDLRDGTDDGHGLASADLTEGHPFLSPGAVPVRDAADWQTTLRTRHVIIDAADRQTLIATRLTSLAEAAGVTLVQDKPLLEEVANLVEWPVPMLGRIDPAYMDLPPEVMQVSMRVNQRYFALRDSQGQAAPVFGFVANIAAPDNGAAIIAGNERVLRARFADARHFWDLDRTATLASRIEALRNVSFQARLGTQFDRAKRISVLAEMIVPRAAMMRSDIDDPELLSQRTELQARAARAGILAKADLTTGMVGEFPELQGIMGGYYAIRDNESADVARAIREHYLPKGPSDALPSGPISVAVALADKIDLVTGFFCIGEAPTGSGDPYALRRAALGIIRIVREQGRWIALLPILRMATEQHSGSDVANEVLQFIIDRLKVQLRAEGHRHDVIDAALAGVAVDDIRILSLRVKALSDFLDTHSGRDLLTANRRGSNILRIEENRDRCRFEGEPDVGRLQLPQERDLYEGLNSARQSLVVRLNHEDFEGAMQALGDLRPATDSFFELTVNDPEPAVRRNRLLLLAKLRDTMNQVADFSKIEG